MTKSAGVVNIYVESEIGLDLPNVQNILMCYLLMHGPYGYILRLVTSSDI